MSTAISQHAYEVFELLVSGRTAEGYPLTVIQSPAGEAKAFCHLDPNDGELRDVLDSLQTRATDAAFLVQMGDFLFQELFVGEMSSLYRTSLGMVRGQGKRLCIRLRIEPPALAALPWEYLYDAQEETPLAISPETALVRYIPLRLPTRPLTISPPLRILVALANPYDLPPLDVAREKELIRIALAEPLAQQRVELRFIEQATLSEVNQIIRSFQPHVFHFVGHGVFAEQGAGVVLENESGAAHLVDEQTFRELFTGAKETRLVVLNACETAATSAGHPLVGLAPRLLQRQLSAVVAMQYAIPDDAALIFAREFYQSLALGYPVDAAIAEARRGLFLHSGGNAPDWGSPVLFLRAADGRLFQVEEAKKSATDLPPPPEPERPPLLGDLIGREVALAFYTDQIKTSGLAVIVGLAGVGKTSLAVALAHQLATPEKTFWHSFQEGEGVQPLIWALAGFLAWRGQEEVWRLLNTPQPSALPQELVVDHLVQRLRNQDYLLCLDNVQFLYEDPLLVKLITRLRQARQQGELAIVVTARSLPAFLQISEAPPLTGLDRTATELLLASVGLSLRPELIAALHEKVEGNPELLLLAANTLRLQPFAERWLQRLVTMADIERYLLHSIDKNLSDNDRDILSAVAILLGYTGPQDVIEQLLDRGQLRRPLRELCDRFLLRTSETEHAHEYGEHALIQAFYYGQLSQRQRLTLHKLAGEYYEREEPNVVKAALHYERSTEMEKAITYLRQAGDQAAQVSAYRNALDFYNRALDLVAKVEKGTSSYPHPQRVILLVKSGEIHGKLGDYKTTQTLCEESLALARANADRQGEADSLKILGIITKARGEYVQTMMLYEQALTIYREIDHQAGEASVLNNLGVIAHNQGEDIQATKFYQQALMIEKTIGHRYGEARALNNLGLIAHDQGKYAQAIQFYQQALVVFRDIGERAGEASVLNNLGLIAGDQGEYARANQLYQQTLVIYRNIGYQYGEALVLNNLGMIAAKYQGEYVQAVEIYQQALTIHRNIGHRAGEAIALGNLAIIAYHQGEYTQASQLSQQALVIHRDINYPYGEASVLNNLGLIAYQQGDYTQATQLYQQTLAIRREISDRSGEAEVLNDLSYIPLQQKDMREARRCIFDALNIGRAIGHVPSVLASLVGIAHVLTYEQQKEQALQLLGLALHHQSIENDTKKRANLLLAELQAALPADVVTAHLEAGKLLNLETVAQEILDQTPA